MSSNRGLGEFPGVGGHVKKQLFPNVPAGHCLQLSRTSPSDSTTVLSAVWRFLGIFRPDLDTGGDLEMPVLAGLPGVSCSALPCPSVEADWHGYLKGDLVRLWGGSAVPSLRAP